MTRLILLVLVVAACGTGPAPTPQIVYITPEPTAAATERATATPPASTSSSVDDERVDEFIRDGFAELSDHISDISNAPDLSAVVSSYREMSSFAQAQQLTAIALQPSTCTSGPLATWLRAMAMVEQLSTDYLDAYESGNFDDFDAEAGAAAGQTARRAVDELNAAC